MKKLLALTLALITLMLPAGAVYAEDDAVYTGPVTVEDIKLDKTKLKLEGGRQYTLTVTVLPDNAFNKAVTFESSNPSVAEVDELGTITAWKKGSCKIKVMAQDGSREYASCSVTVTSSPLVKVDPAGNKFVGVEYRGNVYDLYTPLGAGEEALVKAHIESLGNSTGEKIVKRAAEYLGLSYAEFDCSQLVEQVFRDCGKSMKGTSAAQAYRCRGSQVKREKLRPGDLIFFRHPDGVPCGCSGDTCHRYMGVHHVGIYAGSYGATHYIIDASSTLGKVVIRRWDLSDNYAEMVVVFCAHR